MATAKDSIPSLKRFKKLPIYVVEEHNDALEFIYSAIGRQKLPLEGTTLLHLDAHPDMLVDRKLKGNDARNGRKVLPLLQIENWIVPAVAAGHIERVVWLRPPWARQFTDGTHNIAVGDDPDTGLLRVDSKEPYYLSDALYSSRLINQKQFTLTVAELHDRYCKIHVPEGSTHDFMNKFVEGLNISHPYVLDIDLDFFSTGNPFLSLYKNINLYDRLLPIFECKLPDDDNVESINSFIKQREQQLQELELLFEFLEKDGSLIGYTGEKSELYHKVNQLVEIVNLEAENTNEKPDWWAVYAAGCTRDQGGLPYHISSDEQIRKLVECALKPMLLVLPPPVLITVARSTDDGYCPPHQVEFIQDLVLQTLRDIYETDNILLYYLTVNTLSNDQ